MSDYPLAKLRWAAQDERDKRKRMAAMKEDAERDLLAFVRMCWPIIEPGKPFVEGWIIDFIVDVLMATTAGQLTKVCLNVPPGSMKPVHVDEIVLTDRGPIRLGDVAVGDRVLTHHGRYRRVLTVHDQGTLPTVVVSTCDGRRVRTEGSHPFLTTRGWVPAIELQEGDVCAAVWPQEEVFKDEVTPEEARLMGYFVGDGCLTQSQTRFINMDEEVLADFIHCAESVGLAAKIADSPSHDERRAKTVCVTAGKSGYGAVRQWLTQHDLWRRSSYTKRIPPIILRSSQRIIANFLGAYWSCDGHVAIRHNGVRGDKHIAACTTVSHDLAYDIQHALLRIGIVGRVRVRVRQMVSKRQAGGLYTYYQVMSQSHEEAVKFQRLEGLCSRKRRTLDCMTPQRFVQGPLLEDEVVSVDLGEPGECRCLTVEEDASFTAGGLAVHNSSLLNVLWPAWEWGPQGRPSLRYLSISYSDKVPTRDNLRFAQILKHPVYRQCWGDLFRLTQDGAEAVGNDQTGWKRVSGTGGSVTGFRGDRLCLDDLNNPEDVESETVRHRTERFVREIMPSRVNDLATSAIINLQQRTHQMDATGVLLEYLRDQYTFVCVPAEFDPLRIFPVVLRRDEDGEPEETWVDPRSLDEEGKQLRGLSTNQRGEPVIVPGSPMAQAAGETFWPERFPPDELATLRAGMTPYSWDSQFNQTPGVRGGAIIRQDWWKNWPGEYPALGTVIASLDTAIEEGEQNDYNALTVWGAFAGDQGQPLLLLIAAWRMRATLAELVTRVADTCRERKVDYLLVEHKTRGRDVHDEVLRLNQARSWQTQLVPPAGDKVSRLKAVSRMFSGDYRRLPDGGTDEHGRATYQEVWAGGMIHAPDRDFADEVIAEVASFPYGKHDDYVDSTSMALLWVRQNGVVLHKDEFEEQEMARNKFRRDPGVPYAIRRSR